MIKLMLSQIFIVVFGLASGLVVSGAALAFITMVGVVPRMAEKTKTTDSSMIYEEAIALGGVAGTLFQFFEFYLPLGRLVTAVLSFCGGIFFGALAMSLAEVLDVIPILTRRGKVERGMYYFVMAIAIGKLIGSLAYYLVPGFFTEEG